jgi:hypothetical protein
MGDLVSQEAVSIAVPLRNYLDSYHKVRRAWTRLTLRLSGGGPSVFDLR